jgi:ABC-type sulfate transport system permease component
VIMIQKVAENDITQNVTVNIVFAALAALVLIVIALCIAWYHVREVEAESRTRIAEAEARRVEATEETE